MPESLSEAVHDILPFVAIMGGIFLISVLAYRPYWRDRARQFAHFSEQAKASAEYAELIRQQVETSKASLEATKQQNAILERIANALEKSAN
jgi:hypothetical protein